MNNPERLKTAFIILIICCISVIKANAQIVIDYNQLTASQNVRLRMFLQEEQSEEPIGYASVYLTAPGDSTIAYFALSDEKGEAVVKDIVPGEYVITAEMIGYEPYKITKKLKGWEVNLGAVTMKIDKQMLKAASVSAAGNAVMVKGDTLVYNASAFNVGENAMLEDLIKKMPGMEVDKEGNVTINGEKVDRITVGGKTFFFDDPSMALKNLPAKIVDKISVVDKDKEKAEFTGISTKDDKEKVMDVGLKEEYSKGWFGNVTAKGGSTIMPKNGNQLSDNTRALFSASTMVAGYTEKDQLTILGNGRNVNDDGGGYIMMPSGDDADDFQTRQGQTTSAQGGVNFNTERIKGFDANISASYNYMNKNAKEKSSRTSFMPEGDDILTESLYNGTGDDHKVNVNFDISKKDKKKFMFNIRPSFTFNQSTRNIESIAKTSEAEEAKNTNHTTKYSRSKNFGGNIILNLGVKNLGKERRSISLYGWAFYNGGNGFSQERLNSDFATDTETRNLDYDINKSNLSATGYLSYVEPFGENWSLMASFTTSYRNNHSDRNAFDAETHTENSYYSSLSYNTDLTLSEQLHAQYKKDKTNISFGLALSEQKNRTYTKAMGLENTTGADEWILNWSPFADLRYSKDNFNMNFYTTGWSDTPSGSDIIPVLDITDPLQVSTGNIYLKPQFSYFLNGNIRFNNPKKQNFISLYFNVNLTARQKVYASWFDENSIRYAIPVNSLKPGSSVYAGFNASLPLDRQKNLTLKMYPHFSFRNNFNFQATGILPGLDKENFDYSATMNNFWGNSKGDRFYSGESGFAESKTKYFNYGMQLELQYRIDDFTVAAGGSGTNSISKYSLDSKADMNTWDFGIKGEFIWTGDKGWEIDTDCYYNFYRGYTSGYGMPEVIWNASISKSIKAFTITLSANDILNQRRMLSRSVTSGYMQDTYRNIIGRYVLVGLTFNFGKMNAKNNSNVQNAVYQMMY